MRRLFALVVALQLLSALACSSVPARDDASAASLVRAYYDAVLHDRAPTVFELRRRLRIAGVDAARVEPVGWTVSGKPFANVVSGVVRMETVTVNVSPPRSASNRSRRAPGIVEVCHIERTDLPEYFSWLGETRVGFASIVEDRVYLDERTETDPLLREETLWHEYQHVRDRPLYGRVPASVLEARAMIRGIAEGRVVRLNLARLAAARAGGDPQYRDAAAWVSSALALVLAGSEDAVVERFDDEAIRGAARAIAVVLGL